MHVGCVIFLVIVCCINMNSSDRGLWCLINAAQYVEGNTRDPQQEQSRNNFHGYARSPNSVHDAERNREQDRDSDEISGGDGKERRRNGGRDEHNRLEKDRRAQLKQNFSALKDKIPHLRDKKASNLAILKGAQKQILLLKAKEREHEQTLQTMAKGKVDLLAEFSKRKEQFEHDHGFSADAYLEQLNAADPDDDDQGSDVTLSATEGPDNEHDFDDIEEVSPVQAIPMPPPAAPQNPRGIPHSVIRQAPAISIRLPTSTSDSPQNLVVSPPVALSSQQTTVKKQLQDKLKSAVTKQTTQASVVSQGAIQLANRPSDASYGSGSKGSVVPIMVSQPSNIRAPASPASYPRTPVSPTSIPRWPIRCTEASYVSSSKANMVPIIVHPPSTINNPRTPVSPGSSPRGPILTQPAFIPAVSPTVTATLPAVLPPAPPPGGPSIALPPQATRKVVQSLLPGSNGAPRSFIPTVINGRTSATGVVVAAPLPTSTPFVPVSTAVATLALPNPALASGIKAMCTAGLPSVLVTANGSGQYVIPVHGPNVLVMASPHQQLQSSSISSNSRT